MKRLLWRWLEWRRSRSTEDVMLVVGKLNFDGYTTGPVRMGWHENIDNGWILDRMVRNLANGIEVQYGPLLAPKRGIQVLAAVRLVLKDFDTKAKNTIFKQEFTLDRGDGIILYGQVEILVASLYSREYDTFCGVVSSV